MREILPGIFTWPWFSEKHGYDFNGYLVRAPGGNVCIDPVLMPDEVLEALAREGVSRILLTNRNHTRDSVRLRERTGARIAIHAADAPHAATQGVVADDLLTPGEHAGPFEILAVPGKSPGEVAFYDASRRLLFVGDACVGKPPGGLALLPDAVVDEPARLRASLRALVERVDFDVLLPGDGAPILQGARGVMRALVAGFPAA